MIKALQIHPADNVAVAIAAIAAGESVPVAAATLMARQEIPCGHKIALRDIAAGTDIIKYGTAIGRAAVPIKKGEWVHVHNVKTKLADSVSYSYHHADCALRSLEPVTFSGYLREDGRAAVRNELWIVPLVGCVNSVAQRLAFSCQDLVGGSVEGLYAFTHPFGCSQMGADHAQTRRLLAALCRHPNAGGVLVLGLGCENLTLEQFQNELGTWDDRRVKFLICQRSSDELADGRALLSSLAEYASGFTRKDVLSSKLVVGMKCGGSDGLSGVTANPLVGKFSDLLIARGGSTVLTEVPEMFGAESMLLDRCVSQDVFERAVAMIDGFKNYFTAHGQVVYENPSPGNKEGGITTLEDKSCGCVQKGGSAPVVDVIPYAEQVSKPGLTLLAGPGNDLVSATALTAAGAHVILFTTGRGTPFGAPAPTIKVSSNTQLFEAKRNWIDFNAGTISEGESIEAAGGRFFDFVLSVASGRQTCSERNGYREISIFKDGVVL